MFGSVLTVGREAFSDYRQWSADDIALADYIDENAGSDALFLTSDSHLNAGVCAGRAADTLRVGQLCLLPRHGLLRRVPRHGGRCTSIAGRGARWRRGTWGTRVFDSAVRTAKFADADESWYAARYDVWYENAACRVYQVK